MLKKYIFLLIFSLLLVSCASMHATLSGQGKITDDVSKFDGKRSISMNGAFVNGAFGETSLKIGGFWSADIPNLVIINFTTIDSDYGRIDSVEFNCDGHVSRHTSSSNTRYDYIILPNHTRRFSEKGFAIRLSQLRKIVNAKKCMVRLSTSNGGIVRNISKKTFLGWPQAIIYLRKFLAKVDAARGY